MKSQNRKLFYFFCFSIKLFEEETRHPPNGAAFLPLRRSHMGSQTAGNVAVPERLSAAAARIQPSASNAASQRARQLAAQGKSIVDLTTGEPDFETPGHVCDARLEEHTSELQSLMRISYAVFCLKKKKT